jgi:hypothetical protein
LKEDFLITGWLGYNPVFGLLLPTTTRLVLEVERVLPPGMFAFVARTAIVQFFVDIWFLFFAP